MKKITPWFLYDTKAEEAANFYVSIFPNSKINTVSRYGEGGPVEAGLAMVVEFELEGETFFGLNSGEGGGLNYKFSEATSFSVACKDQAEVDHYWNSLTEGGEESMCGWLVDKYGLSWQIVPTRLTELMSDPDPERSGRTMQAMMQMRKIDIATLERAANGEA